MAKFNTVAEKLLVPFADNEISERLMNPKKPESEYNPKFTYVDPAHYRRRFLEVFTNGFEFGAVPESVKEGEDGVRSVYFFKASVPEEGVEYVVTGVPVFEEWTRASKFLWNNDTRAFDRPNPDAGKVINRAETYKALTSAGYKAVAREIGVGLHLYDKPAVKVGGATTGRTSSAPAQAATPATNSTSGDWDGSKTIGFGKNKGKPYSEVEDSYLSWVSENMKDPAKGDALAEMARRGKSAGATGAAKANEALNSNASGTDKEEFPYF